MHDLITRWHKSGILVCELASEISASVGGNDKFDGSLNDNFNRLMNDPLDLPHHKDWQLGYTCLPRDARGACHPRLFQAVVG